MISFTYTWLIIPAMYTFMYGIFTYMNGWLSWKMYVNRQFLWILSAITGLFLLIFSEGMPQWKPVLPCPSHSFSHSTRITTGFPFRNWKLHSFFLFYMGHHSPDPNNPYNPLLSQRFLKKLLHLLLVWSPPKGSRVPFHDPFFSATPFPENRVKELVKVA